MHGSGYQVDVPDSIVGGLHGEPVPLLTLPKHLGGALALRDVEIDTCDSNRLPSIVPEYSTFSEKPVDATIRPDDAKFLVPDVSPCERILIVLPNPLAIFRMDQCEPFLVCEPWMGRR